MFRSFKCVFLVHGGQVGYSIIPDLFGGKGSDQKSKL